MLQITIPATELWDERKKEFVYVEEQTLDLEHSLVSLSKWESKWRKSFVETKNKTNEEALDYIKCMTITPNVRPEVYLCLTDDNIKQIKDYIDAPMTATVLRNSPDSKPNRDTITAELIYYWMTIFNIHPSYENWHLNRLITLIRVCDVKSSPPKKRSSAEIMAEHISINEANKRRFNTKG